MADIDINPSSMGPLSGVCIGPPMVYKNGPSVIGPQLFVSRAVLIYAMFLVSLNYPLWAKLHG